MALNNIVRNEKKMCSPSTGLAWTLLSEIASRILHREFSITGILRFFIRNVTFRQRFELVIHNCETVESRTDRQRTSKIFCFEIVELAIDLQISNSSCGFEVHDHVKSIVFNVKYFTGSNIDYNLPLPKLMQPFRRLAEINRQTCKNR